MNPLPPRITSAPHHHPNTGFTMHIGLWCHHTPTRFPKGQLPTKISDWIVTLLQKTLKEKDMPYKVKLFNNFMSARCENTCYSRKKNYGFWTDLKPPRLQQPLPVIILCNHQRQTTHQDPPPPNGLNITIINITVSSLPYLGPLQEHSLPLFPNLAGDHGTGMPVPSTASMRETVHRTALCEIYHRVAATILWGHQ